MKKYLTAIALSAILAMPLMTGYPNGTAGDTRQASHAACPSHPVNTVTEKACGPGKLRETVGACRDGSCEAGGSIWNHSGVYLDLLSAVAG